MNSIGINTTKLQILIMITCLSKNVITVETFADVDINGNGAFFTNDYERLVFYESNKLAGFMAYE